MSGHTNGFDWTKEETRRKLKELCIAGDSASEIAEKFSTEFKQEITISMITNTKNRLGFSQYLLARDPNIKIYKELTLPDDNYMISCDEHAPYHSEL